MRLWCICLQLFAINRFFFKEAFYSCAFSITEIFGSFTNKYTQKFFLFQHWSWLAFFVRCRRVLHTRPVWFLLQLDVWKSSLLFRIYKVNLCLVKHVKTSVRIFIVTSNLQKCKVLHRVKTNIMTILFDLLSVVVFDVVSFLVVPMSDGVGGGLVLHLSTHIGGGLAPRHSANQRMTSFIFHVV